MLGSRVILRELSECNVQYTVVGDADCVRFGFKTHQCAGACRVKSSIHDCGGWSELRLMTWQRLGRGACGSGHPIYFYTLVFPAVS